MIDIINNILSNNGYQQVDIDVSFDNLIIYLFCPLDGNNREEYFVTVQLENQSEAAAQEIQLEKAQELFEAISNSGKVDCHFEKNSTLILCQEEEVISQKTILFIEEDQYNFKKNVIVYTSAELVDLKAHLSENGIEKITNQVINSIINSDGGQSFIKFKYGVDNIKNHYSLMLKAVLKLPFITYNPQEQKLSNLDDQIEGSLDSSQLALFKRLIESNIEWTDENIHHQISTIWGGAQ